jgi:hypothetical protein
MHVVGIGGIARFELAVMPLTLAQSVRLAPRQHRIDSFIRIPHGIVFSLCF